MTPRRWRAAVAALGLALGACATVPESTPATALEIRPPAGFPQEPYLLAAKQGEVVYRIDSPNSLATIYSYRSRLGHNHVIASHHVEGFARLARDGSIGQADLYVPLDALTVDEAELRKQAGFDTQPSPSDIAGTRNNMLNKVLEVGQYPYATIHVERVEREQDSSVLVATLMLHGTARALRIPVQLAFDQKQLTVSGKFSIKQTDFGMTPFSVLGGLFQVKDELDLGFTLRATRLS